MAGNPLPLATIPTLFSDGVANASPVAGTVRFHLMRLDPAVSGEVDGANNGIVAQVIMSTEGFLSTALFFEQMVPYLVERGIVRQSRVDELRKAVESPHAVKSLGIPPG